MTLEGRGGSGIADRGALLDSDKLERLDSFPMATRPDLAGLIADLATAQVRFVVCGGVACVLHGVERVTMDLDLRLPEDDSNFSRLVSALEARGMVSRIPEPMTALCDPKRRQAWIREKDALVWTAQSSDGVEQIDVFLSYPISWDDLLRDALTVNVRESSVRISSKAHLIQAKKLVQPPRRKDLRDIEDLEALP